MNKDFIKLLAGAAIAAAVLVTIAGCKSSHLTCDLNENQRIHFKR